MDKSDVHKITKSGRDSGAAELMNQISKDRKNSNESKETAESGEQANELTFNDLNQG